MTEIVSTAISKKMSSFSKIFCKISDCLAYHKIIADKFNIIN